MKRNVSMRLLIFSVLAILVCSSAVFAEGLGKVVKVSEIGSLPKDAKVVFSGKITGTKIFDLFTLFVLDDGSGEVLLDIDSEMTREQGIELKAGDVVEVAGSLDNKQYGLKVDVEAFLKDGATPKYTTVSDANKKRNDEPAVLKGHLKLKVDKKRYTFADETGEIVVKIEREEWGDLTHKPNQLVEIWGEMDIDDDNSLVQIDVGFIREL